MISIEDGELKVVRRDEQVLMAPKPAKPDKIKISVSRLGPRWIAEVQGTSSKGDEPTHSGASEQEAIGKAIAANPSLFNVEIVEA